MSTRRHTIVDGPTKPIESGVFIDSFRVERVIATRAELYTVVEAQAPDGERVALTLLAPPLVKDRELRRRVVGLARLRASIEHPNMIEFRGAVENRNRVYLVSAPPAARTLADLLREGPLSTEDALRLLGQVAGALETAAARGLTHRDLTPQAIVLQEEDDGQRPLLTDFGIALPPAPGCDMLGDGTAYRSPEEVRGLAPEPESSVYSLACILVECLTGASPYPYDRPLLTLHAHLVEPPPQVSERRPDLPLALDEVVAKGLAKDPRRRSPSPAELMRAAADALGTEVAVPVIGAPPHERRRVRSAPARIGSPRKIRRTAAWIGVALLASAMSGFAIGGADWSADPQPPPPARSHVAQDQDQVQNAAYTQRVTRAVERLRERRVAARERLRAAQAPAGQAAAAEALAHAYRSAREALPPPLTGGADLSKSLRSAERSYRKLAAAARGRDPREWRVARREALRREAALDHALRTGRLS
jgi:Protein kinase domain